jgi:peptidoglycan hydrolase CwlO-like protein
MVAFIYNIRTETFELEDEQRRLRQRNHQLENEMALLENENGQLRQQQLTLERLVDRCAREHDRTASYTEEHSHVGFTISVTGVQG